jgi:two-component system phosphate regulon response regulator PhoB
VVATILVVDDERPVRELLAALLADAGHRVLTAAHGQQALELVAAERPDLVLSDLMMPVLGGADLCRRLKADAAAGATPVILMSSAHARLAQSAGADAFIAKPFDLEAMEAVVRAWLPAEAGGALA